MEYVLESPKPSTQSKMKNLKLVVVALFFLLAGTAKAQVSVSVNIGSPPMWGPVGYTEVRYYYIPAVECYYDVGNSMFIYFDNGVWVNRRDLPYRYRNYDLYNGYKVVMVDYQGNTPYTSFGDHKKQYGKRYHGDYQKTIGENPGRGNSNGNNKSKGSNKSKGKKKGN